MASVKRISRMPPFHFPLNGSLWHLISIAAGVLPHPFDGLELVVNIRRRFVVTRSGQLGLYLSVYTCFNCKTVRLSPVLGALQRGKYISVRRQKKFSTSSERSCYTIAVWSPWRSAFLTTFLLTYSLTYVLSYLLSFLPVTVCSVCMAWGQRYRLATDLVLHFYDFVYQILIKKSDHFDSFFMAYYSWAQLYPQSNASSLERLPSSTRIGRIALSGLRSDPMTESFKNTRMTFLTSMHIDLQQ